MSEQEVQSGKPEHEVCKGCGYDPCVRLFPGLRQSLNRRRMSKGKPPLEGKKCRLMKEVCPSCGYNPSIQAHSDLPEGMDALKPQH